MYCSSCGVAIAKGLSYCNQCGAKLSGAKGDGVTKVAQATPDLVWAIVAVFVVGLGSIMGLMAIMKEQFNANLGIVLVFTFIIFLLMIVVEGVFISLLFGSRSASKVTSEKERLNEHATRELDAAQPRVLPEPVSSVTDQTTRAFEPAYRQKRAE